MTFGAVCQERIHLFVTNELENKDELTLLTMQRRKFSLLYIPDLRNSNLIRLPFDKKLYLSCPLF